MNLHKHKRFHIRSILNSYSLSRLSRSNLEPSGIPQGRLSSCGRWNSTNPRQYPLTRHARGNVMYVLDRCKYESRKNGSAVYLWYSSAMELGYAVAILSVHHQSCLRFGFLQSPIERQLPRPEVRKWQRALLDERIENSIDVQLQGLFPWK
jgi:hypothetical protein